MLVTADSNRLGLLLQGHLSILPATAALRATVRGKNLQEDSREVRAKGITTWFDTEARETKLGTSAPNDQ